MSKNNKFVRDVIELYSEICFIKRKLYQLTFQSTFLFHYEIYEPSKVQIAQ